MSPQSLTVDVATHADVEGIVALNVEHNGADTEAPLRALLADPGIGPERFTVVRDGERVVSTLCLLDAKIRFRAGGTADAQQIEVDVPVGQPEYVATDPAHRGRGLIRTQVDLVHRWSDERGDLAQLISGIPYFYRQFGYEYATMPLTDSPVPAGTQTPPGWSVRRATPDDTAEIVALQDEAQRGFDVVLLRSAPGWRRALSTEADGRHRVAIAPDGTVAGYAFVETSHGPRDVFQPAAARPAAVLALLADAMAEGPDGTAEGPGVDVRSRPGTLVDRVVAPLASARRRVGWGPVLRVPDAAVLLRHLRPALEARLAASAFAAASGTLLLSFYRHVVRIGYETGRIVSIEPGPGGFNPRQEGGIGVPPDLVATLLFGAHGASGLAERHPDVQLGALPGLADVLFPRLTFDGTYW